MGSQDRRSQKGWVYVSFFKVLRSVVNRSHCLYTKHEGKRKEVDHGGLACACVCVTTSGPWPRGISPAAPVPEAGGTPRSPTLTPDRRPVFSGPSTTRASYVLFTRLPSAFPDSPTLSAFSY